MKVSVLLASFNGERFLPAQLASLRSQTESDIGILWQDDGSVDGSRSILEDLSREDPRFRPGLEQGRHFGAPGNFFSMLRQTDSDYILFCDQDDIWEPFKISVLLRACRAAEKEMGPKAPVLVHSDAALIDENGHRLAPGFFALQGWDPRAVGLNRLLVQNNVTGCMLLMNRALADLAVRYGDPSRMFMHDWFIALTAAAFGRIVFLDQPLTLYRQHGENAIGASRDSLFRRGMKALREREKARERIALTYSHARAFADAYGGTLPPDARKTVDAYLATEFMPKFQRIRTVYRLGCLMQSPLTRMGQFFFG